MGIISDSENTVEMLISRHISVLLCIQFCHVLLIYSAVMNILRFFRLWRSTQHIVVCHLRKSLSRFSTSPTDTMAHTKRILVPIDDKEHCVRAFDCKCITAAEF